MTDTPKIPLPKSGKTDIQKPAPETAPTPEVQPETGKESGKDTGEFGGRGGSDPTRFGDWEKDGRCVDF